MTGGTKAGMGGGPVQGRSEERGATWWSATVGVVAFIIYGISVFGGRFYERELVSRGLEAQEGDTETFVAFTLITLVACVLVWLVPRNLVAWIFLAMALLGVVGFAGVNYAAYSAQIRPLPGGVVLAWFGSWAWYPTLAMIMIFLPLYFPTGRLLTRRWKWVARGGVLGLVILCGRFAFAPGELDIAPVTNPLGISSLEPALAFMEGLAAIMLGIVAGASLVSAILRFRRARGQERQQLKWFVFGLGLMISTTFLLIAIPGLEAALPLWLNNLIFAVTVSLVPVAAAIAVLKYRLYAIDTIINRVLVYGLLTGLLVGGYLIAVVGFQAVLEPFTGGSDLAIAASTLGVAAAFRPLRSRLQSFIDRRFYRHKYDGVRAIAGFAARLRDEVELDVVRSDVLAVVNATVQPASATLWLSPKESR